MIDGFLTADDLNALAERRRLSEKVVLRLEDGTVLASGHRAFNEFDEALRFSREQRGMAYYARGAVVWMGYTQSEIDSYLAEKA